MIPLNLSFFIPEITGGILLAWFIFESILTGKKDRLFIFRDLLIGTMIVGITLLFFHSRTGTGFGGMLVADSFSFYFKLFFTAVFFTVVLISREFLKHSGLPKQALALILWCAFLSLYILSSAVHFLVLFIAIEILTMSLYILTAYIRHRSAGVEAGLKYFILGSLASAFMIFGIALIYLKTGSLYFYDIGLAKTVLWGHPLGLLALLLFFAGIGFKIAAFPFQLWVPDVYQGAPSPVTAFMSVASKSAGFMILIRFFSFTLGDGTVPWNHITIIIALFTLLYGGLGALAQTSFKRLMGYSSISHAGYLLIAFASNPAQGLPSILYYLTGYAVATLAVFLVIGFIEKSTGSDALENFEGLYQTSPFVAGNLLIALLSLAGVPPLAGFMGKFWILFSAVTSGQTVLTVAGLGMVVVGIYYYFSILIKIFFRKPRFEKIVPLAFSAQLLLFSLSLFSVGIGLFQGPLIRIAAAALPTF